MKKSILFIALAALIFVTILFAQNTNTSIEKRWKTVDELAAKQLPESALKEVESILAQAQKEKNSVEVIKAMVYKMRFTLEKNPDEAPTLIKDFEAFTEKSTDPAERALLHSMTAELYAQFYQRDQWTINQRTEVVGVVPDDMKEWTRNIYFDKISKHLAASMENPEVLQKTDALKFAGLMEKGDDSRELQPTLFDFLGNRKIDILKNNEDIEGKKNPLTNPEYFNDANQFIALGIDTSYINSFENQIVETYQKLLTYRLKTRNTAALMNLNLERLEYFHSNSGNESADSLYLEALNRLEKQYSTNEFVVEVLAEKASNYFEKANNKDEENSLNPAESSNLKRKAYDICSNGIKLFPKYKRIGILYNIQKEIRRKNLTIDFNNVTKLNSGLKVKIKSSNISSLQLSVYKINASALEYYKYKLKEYPQKSYPNRTLLETRLIPIKKDLNFGEVNSEVIIKPQNYGIYEFYLEPVGNKKISGRAHGEFVVSDFSFIKRMNEEKIINLYVLDRQSGNPISNVQVKVFNQRWNKNGYKLDSITSVLTSRNGACTYPSTLNYTNDFYFFKKGKDAYFSSQLSSYFHSNIQFENTSTRVDFFTDRAIYRPGQTVHFKGIAFYSYSKKEEVAANLKFEVTLTAANGQKVTSKTFTSNEFGSFSGEFILPEGGLNGSFMISTEVGSTYFWVEEYKRPTFEVLIEKPKSEINFGEKITVLGTVKAYAGYTIGDAKVKYRVVRRVHHFCWWFSEPEEVIANGSAKSKLDGSFEIPFVASKSKTKSYFSIDRAYSYTIYTDVTDPNGETQQGEKTISVGDKSLFIIAGIPEKINKDEKTSIDISTETINDEKINSTLKYSVYRLVDSEIYNENLDETKDLKVTEQVLSGSFETKNKRLELDLKNMNSGRYKFIFTTLDAHGKEVKLEKTFVLYNSEDKRPPVKSYVWLLRPKTDCAVGETAKIQFGTSTQNSMVLYEIMQGNKILESRWISFSDEIKSLDIPFKESYGAGVTVMFTFMKDEQLFTESIQLTRKIPEKKLTPTLSVFRNKLLPGEKAEWTITVPESAKNKKPAELLVGMYDASLDALRTNNWNFYPTFRENVLYSPVWQASPVETSSDNISSNVHYIKVYDYQFNQLNWFGLEMEGYYRRGRFFSRPPALRNSVKFTAPVIKKDEEVMSIADVKQEVEGEPFFINGPEMKKNNTEEAPVRIRTNFNETAFFYPQLRTDSAGNVKFTFTAPESLTRWNVKMLAHTKDLYFGQGEVQVVTQKDLMVQMNLPRFVRRSDKLVLSANVVNLTDKELNASIQYEMIDPETEKLSRSQTVITMLRSI